MVFPAFFIRYTSSGPSIDTNAYLILQLVSTVIGVVFRELWKGFKSFIKRPFIQTWRLDTRCVSGLALQSQLIGEVTSNDQNKSRKWWAPGNAVTMLFWYALWHNLRRIGVSWSDYQFRLEIAQRSRINVSAFLFVLLHALSKCCRFDWLDSGVDVRSINDSDCWDIVIITTMFCIYLDAFSPTILSRFYFLLNPGNDKGVNHENRSMGTIHYSVAWFHPFALWVVALCRIWTQEHRLLLWIYRAVQVGYYSLKYRWYILIERHRGRPPLYIPYHLQGRWFFFSVLRVSLRLLL